MQEVVITDIITEALEIHPNAFFIEKFKEKCQWPY